LLPIDTGQAVSSRSRHLWDWSYSFWKPKRR